MTRTDGAPPRIEARGIEKRFGPIVVLRGVDLSVAAGEVVGVVGDNGAGKSTLMKVLAGAYEPDGGHVALDGVPIRFDGPGDAHRLGIEMIYQDLALCDDLDVAANFFVGRELSWFGLVRRREMHTRTRAELEALGIDLPSTSVKVKSLSGGQRQAIAVGRATTFTARVLIMDEPTAALGVREVSRTLDLVRRVKERGVSVIIISHRLQDLFAVCDRLVVLYEGRIVGDLRVEDTSLEDIVERMVGRSHFERSGA